MIELLFLGTGGWVATKERDNTSFLLDTEKELILIDCPGSVIQKIKKLDRDPCEVSSIFITHIHPDHVYGLPSLVHSLMFEERIIKLYGSQQTIDFCAEMLDLFRLRHSRIKVEIQLMPLFPGEDIQVTDSICSSPFEVSHHLSSLAFSFQFLREEKKLLYSGDTSLHAPLFRKAKEFDFLIHECSAPKRYFEEYPMLYSIHSNSYELGKLAQENQVKCLIPCHFFGDLDFSVSDMAGEIRNNFRGRLIMPEDLMRIELE
jgi:ribonuclease Z